MLQQGSPHRHVRRGVRLQSVSDPGLGRKPEANPVQQSLPLDGYAECSGVSCVPRSCGRGDRGDSTGAGLQKVICGFAERDAVFQIAEQHSSGFRK